MAITHRKGCQMACLVRKTIDEETAANWFPESGRLHEKATAEAEDVHFAALVTGAHLRGSCFRPSEVGWKKPTFECTENLALSCDSPGIPPHDK